MKAVLLAVDGGLVHRCEIPDFHPPAGGVIWGGRFFRLNDAVKFPSPGVGDSFTLGEIAYTESIVHTISDEPNPNDPSRVLLTLARPVIYKKAVVICGSYGEYKEYMRCRASDPEVVQMFGEPLTQRNSMFLGNVDHVRGYDRDRTYLIYCGNHRRNAEARDPYMRIFKHFWHDERPITLQPSLRLHPDPSGEPYVGHPASMPIMDEDL